MAFITKEVPTGAINGVNTTFTLANNINTIDDVFIDGAIYLGTITPTGGAVFTVADAPTVSIFVDYYDAAPTAPTGAPVTTGQSIIDNARENLKIDPGKTVWTDVQLLRWMNEGVVMMTVAQEWKDVETTASIAFVNGTATYTPADSYERMITNSVTFTDSDGAIRSLKYVQLHELQATNPDLTVTGDYPQYVYETAEKLGFFPVPNATAATGTLAYRYFGWPDTYTLLNSPIFPSQWHYLLEHYIEYRAWGILPGRENSSSLALQKWERGLGKMKQERLRRMGPDFQWRTLAKEEKNKI